MKGSPIGVSGMPCSRRRKHRRPQPGDGAGPRGLIGGRLPAAPRITAPCPFSITPVTKTVSSSHISASSIRLIDIYLAKHRLEPSSRSPQIQTNSRHDHASLTWPVATVRPPPVFYSERLTSPPPNRCPSPARHGPSPWLPKTQHEVW